MICSQLFVQLVWQWLLRFQILWLLLILATVFLVEDVADELLDFRFVVLVHYLVGIFEHFDIGIRDIIHWNLDCLLNPQVIFRSFLEVKLLLQIEVSRIRVHIHHKLILVNAEGGLVVRVLIGHFLKRLLARAQ